MITRVVTAMDHILAFNYFVPIVFAFSRMHRIFIEALPQWLLLFHINLDVVTFPIVPSYKMKLAFWVTMMASHYDRKNERFRG